MELGMTQAMPHGMPDVVTLESLGIKLQPQATNLPLAALLQRDGAVPTELDTFEDPQKRAETLVFMSRKRKKRDPLRPMNALPAFYFFTRDKKDLLEQKLQQEPMWDEIKHDRYKVNTALNDLLIDSWERMTSTDKHPYVTLEAMDAQRYADEMKRFLADKAANEFAIARTTPSGPRKPLYRSLNASSSADSQPEYQHPSYNHIAHLASIPNVRVYTAEGEFELSVDDVRANARREHNARLRIAIAALEEEIGQLRREVLLHGKEITQLQQQSHLQSLVNSRANTMLMTPASLSINYISSLPMLGAFVIVPERGLGAQQRGQVVAPVPPHTQLHPHHHGVTEQGLYKVNFEDGTTELMKDVDILQSLDMGASTILSSQPLPPDTASGDLASRRHITFVGLPVQKRDPLMMGLVSGVAAHAGEHPTKYVVFLENGAFEEWPTDLVKENLLEMNNPVIASAVVALANACAQATRNGTDASMPVAMQIDNQQHEV